MIEPQTAEQAAFWLLKRRHERLSYEALRAELEVLLYEIEHDGAHFFLFPPLFAAISARESTQNRSKPII
jgi:hypothetical protein